MSVHHTIMTPPEPSPVQNIGWVQKAPQPLLRFGLFLVVLSLLFGKPLWDLARYAFANETYSHIFLMPLLVGYLIVLRRKELPPIAGSPSPRPTGRGQGEGFGFIYRVTSWIAAIPFALGIASLGTYAALAWNGGQASLNDYLSLTIFAFVCFALSGGIVFLGRQIMGALVFPAALLFFLVPFPDFFMEWVESFLQHASAEAANILLSLSGTPFLREGLVFRLPSIPLEVARECSGIRSSLVLFISSLLAGCLFLRNPWYRAALAISVVPLGILRNGFRIFTIGMLCVHVSPDMINSPLHRQGGPLFFLLSLVPFFILLLYLRRVEKNRKALK